MWYTVRNKIRVESLRLDLITCDHRVSVSDLCCSDFILLLFLREFENPRCPVDFHATRPSTYLLESFEIIMAHKPLPAQCNAIDLGALSRGTIR